MAGLTTQFGGNASLPTGWTFEQNGSANAVLDNTGNSAKMTIPGGTTSNTITGTGDSDDTCGLVHAISGDFDIAYRCSTAIGGDDSAMIGFIIKGSSDASKIRYTPYAANDSTYHYGVERHGGSSQNFASGGPVNSTEFLNGHGAWFRAKRVGTAYTFYWSGDGVNWVQTATVTSSVEGQEIKICLGQYSAVLGLPFRVDEVFDIGAEATTDARGTLDTYNTETAVTTDLTSIPAWLTTKVVGSGTATQVGSTVELATAVADGSGARLKYAGASTFANAGALFKVQFVSTGGGGNDNFCYIAAGLAVDDGTDGLDVYTEHPMYGLEIKFDGEAVPIRTHRPVTINSLNESYSFLGDASRVTGIAGTTTTYIRVEKFGKLVRMRRWDAAVQEPSTWDYEGIDDVLRGEGHLEPYIGVGHNDGQGSTAKVVVDDVEFYELTAAAPAVYYPGLRIWDGTEFVVIIPNGGFGEGGGNGQDGADGLSVLNGSGAPSDGTGVDGEFYIDTSANTIYGPKAAGTWTGTGPTSLVGPQGPAGSDGADGAQGPQGPQGPQGDPGADGADGADGAAGSKWYSGAGAPAGGTGVVGDWYLNETDGGVYEKTGASTWTLRDNLTGPTGATGPQGPAGADGSDGATGPQGPAGADGAAGADGSDALEYEVNTLTGVSGTQALGEEFGAHHVTMTGNTTFTFDNPAVENGHAFTLYLTGAHTPTFPGTVEWDGVPSYTSPTVYGFQTFDGGANWVGVVIGEGVS